MIPPRFRRDSRCVSIADTMWVQESNLILLYPFSVTIIWVRRLVPFFEIFSLKPTHPNREGYKTLFTHLCSWVQDDGALKNMFLKFNSKVYKMSYLFLGHLKRRFIFELFPASVVSYLWLFNYYIFKRLYLSAGRNSCAQSA